MIRDQPKPENLRTDPKIQMKRREVGSGFGCGTDDVTTTSRGFERRGAITFQLNATLMVSPYAVKCPDLVSVFLLLMRDAFKCLIITCVWGDKDFLFPNSDLTPL